jgi:hypothetical protein
MTLNPVETLALNNALATAEVKAAREAVGPGTYPVEFTVTVKGTVTVGTDTEKTPTASIPVTEVLALFIARSGATRDANIALLKECLADALTKGTKGAGAVEEAALVDQVFKDKVKEITSSLPKTPVKGAVKVKATLALADEQDAAQTATAQQQAV